VHILGICLVVTEPRGRVLLLRTTKAGWELPGGRVEPGEDLIEAGRREALEESGCAVEVGRLTGLYMNVDAAMLLLVFRATSETTEPQPANSAAIRDTSTSSLPSCHTNAFSWPRFWRLCSH
jgi:8-oxo-dGTP pyrophosphatase MutT (NUDIX family)